MNSIPVFLLITMIIITASIEVIEDDGIMTEDQDMAKALAQSKRFIWRNFVAKWHCDNIQKHWYPILGKKVKEKQLREICQKWQMLEIAVDAYVKSWECNQLKMFVHTQAESSNATGKGENPIECLCVKPWLGLEQGELLMSSAMEVIKAVYRDLFGWGKGKHFKIEIGFKNLCTWATVEYLRVKHKNEKNPADKEILERLLMLVSEALVRDPYLLNPDELLPDSARRRDFHQRLLMHYAKKNTVAPILTEETVKETLENGEEHKFVSEINGLDKEFRQKLSTKDKCMNEGVDQLSYSDFKLLNDCFKKLWNNVQEIGLDMAEICDARKKYEQENSGDPTKCLKIACAKKQLLIDVLKNVNKKQQKTSFRTMEKNVGIILWLYKHKVNDQFVEKHPAEEQLGLVPDPCVEAMLKVKKKPSSVINGVAIIEG